MFGKILIATGGTGGHIYPAIALSQQLTREVPECQLLFIGGGLDKNRYFNPSPFAFRTIHCGNFVNKSPLAVATSLMNITKGVWQSRKIIREFTPDVVVGFGSFYAFPPLIAAKFLGVPIILHEGNSVPGRVNRFAAPWAEYIGVHFPETARLLKGKAVEVGMPLRDGFCFVRGKKVTAKEHYGFKKDQPVILIFGGSQGSQMINRNCSSVLSRLSNKLPFQVLHLTGNEQIIPQLEEKYRQSGVRAYVKAFENNMQMAWHAADLMIGRSGAGTIAEQLEFEIPGILIPFANASENHQDHNADFMAATVGGAVKIEEAELMEDRLTECVQQLMKDNGMMLRAMQDTIRTYKMRVRTKDLCSLVKELLASG